MQQPPQRTPKDGVKVASATAVGKSESESESARAAAAHAPRPEAKGGNGGGGAAHDGKEIWLMAIQKKDEKIRELQTDFDRVVHKLSQQSIMCAKLSDEVEKLRRALNPSATQKLKSTGKKLVTHLKGALLDPPAAAAQQQQRRRRQSGPLKPPPPPPSAGPPPAPVPKEKKEEDEDKEKPLSGGDDQPPAARAEEKKVEGERVGKREVKGEEPPPKDGEPPRDALGDGAGDEDEAAGDSKRKRPTAHPPSGPAQGAPRPAPVAPSPPGSRLAAPPALPANPAGVAARTARTGRTAKRRMSENLVAAEKGALVVQLKREEAALRRLVKETEKERAMAAERGNMLARDLEAVTGRYAAATAEVIELRGQLESEEQEKGRLTRTLQKYRGMEKEIERQSSKIESLNAWITESSTVRSQLEEERESLEEKVKELEAKVLKNDNEGADNRESKEKEKKIVELQNALEVSKARALAAEQLAKGKDMQISEASKKFQKDMEQLKLEEKIRSRKRERLVTELKRGLQQSETSREKLRIQHAQMQLNYEALRGQLNSVSARSPPPTAPPPPPKYLVGTPASIESPSTQWSRQLRMSGKRSMSFSLGGLSVFGGRGSKRLPSLASPSTSQSSLPPPTPPSATTPTSPHTPKPKLPVPARSDGGQNQPRSKPPPPKWSQQAEQDYVLGIGKRLEMLAEENFKLRQQVKFLEENVQSLHSALEEKKGQLTRAQAAARHSIKQQIKFASKLSLDKEESTAAGISEDLMEENKLLRLALKNMAVEVRELSDKVNRYKNGYFESQNASGVEVVSIPSSSNALSSGLDDEPPAPRLPPERVDIAKRRLSEPIDKFEIKTTNEFKSNDTNNNNGDANALRNFLKPQNAASLSKNDSSMDTSKIKNNLSNRNSVEISFGSGLGESLNSPQGVSGLIDVNM